MAAYRVLVITNLWPTADDPGYGSFVQAQMESLRPLAVDYDVLFINGRASRWNYLRAIPEMRRRQRAGRYDLVHAHFGLSGWVARCQLGAPVVVSFMGDDVLGRFERSGRVTLYGRLLQASSLVLARVIPNGVDLDLFRPLGQAEARRELGLDPEKKLVLFPYNPAEPRKRFDLIEVAVERARQDVPGLEILHARGVPRRRMPLYMNAADVFVLASLAEGSPNALKEAMAVNLPLITVDVGDAAERIGSAEGCYLVPREAEAIAARIVEVCRKGARSRGREAIAHLSIENVARRIVEVYAAAAASSSPPRL